MAWKKGESGNPHGRPPNPIAERFREAAESSLDEIITVVVDAAKGGDLQAAKMILDRVWPALRPVDPPAQVPIPEDATIAEQARAVVAAVMNGTLPANQASALLSALAAVERMPLGELEQEMSIEEKEVKIREMLKEMNFI